MTATVSHFKVGNGDMTLFRLNDGRRLLVDINIRRPPSIRTTTRRT